MDVFDGLRGMGMAQRLPGLVAQARATARVAVGMPIFFATAL